MMKRILAFLLVFALVLPMCPVMAFAEEAEQTESAVEQTEPVIEQTESATEQAEAEAASDYETLVANQPQELYMQGGEIRYFTFTVEQSGDYCFWAEGSFWAVYSYIMDAECRQEFARGSTWCSCYLEAGETYTLMLHNGTGDPQYGTMYLMSAVEPEDFHFYEESYSAYVDKSIYLGLTFVPTNVADFGTTTWTVSGDAEVELLNQSVDGCDLLAHSTGTVTVTAYNDKLDKSVSVDVVITEMTRISAGEYELEIDEDGENEFLLSVNESGWYAVGRFFEDQEWFYVSGINLEDGSWVDRKYYTTALSNGALVYLEAGQNYFIRLNRGGNGAGTVVLNVQPASYTDGLYAHQYTHEARVGEWIEVLIHPNDEVSVMEQVTWESSNPDVAEINYTNDDLGYNVTLIAKSEGQTILTGSTEDGDSIDIIINVVPPVETIPVPFGENIEISSSYGEEKYYTFTAEVSGRYVFARDTSTPWFRFELMMENDGMGVWALVNWFSAQGLEGYVTELREGQRYRICVNGNEWEEVYGTLYIGPATKPQQLHVPQQQYTVYSGESVDVNIRTSGIFDKDSVLTWTLEDDSIARIHPADGGLSYGVRILGMCAGQTTVHVTADNGVSTSFELIVRESQTMLVNEASVFTIPAGDEVGVQLTVPDDGMYSIWREDDNWQYVHITVFGADGNFICEGPDGHFYACAGDTVFFNLRNDSDQDNVFTFRCAPTVDPEGINLLIDSTTVNVGEVVYVYADSWPVNSFLNNVTWETQGDVFVIEEHGPHYAKLRILQPGEQVLSATGDFGITGSITITALDSPDAVVGEPYDVFIPANSTRGWFFTAPATDQYIITDRNNNWSYIEVYDMDGFRICDGHNELTLHAEENATYFIKLSNWSSEDRSYCYVIFSVSDLYETINLDDVMDVAMSDGDYLYWRFTAPYDGRFVLWSDDPDAWTDIQVYDPEGNEIEWANVRAFVDAREGETYSFKIRASYGDYREFRMGISEVTPVQSLELSHDTLKMSTGTYFYSVWLTADRPTADLKELVWTSSNEDVVRVSWSCYRHCDLYAVGEGTATLTATVGDFSVSCVVTVTDPVEMVLDESYEITVPCYEYSYYRFVAPETANYTLWDQNYMYQYIELYNENGEYITGSGNKIQFDAQSGETFLFRFENWSDDPNLLFNYTVRKTVAPEYIRIFDTEEVNGFTGYDFTIRAKTYPENSFSGQYEWTVSNDDVISIYHSMNQSCRFKCWTVGEATITVRDTVYNLETSAKMIVHPTPILELDKTTTINLVDSGAAGAYFTPEQSGRHTLRVDASQGVSVGVLSYQSNGEQIQHDHFWVHPDWPQCDLYLEEGVQYRFYISSEAAGQADFTISYTEPARIHVGDVMDLTLTDQNIELIFEAPADGIYVLWDDAEREFPVACNVFYPEYEAEVQFFQRVEIHANAGHQYHITLWNPHGENADQLPLRLHLEEAVAAEDFQLYVGVGLEQVTQLNTYSQGMVFLISAHSNDPRAVVTDLEWTISDEDIVGFHDWIQPGATAFISREAGTATITATSQSLGISRSFQVTFKDYPVLETGVDQTIELRKDWYYAEVMLFTPEHSGRYSFTLDSEKRIQLSLHDNEGFYDWSILGGDHGNQMHYELEAGKTYYVETACAENPGSDTLTFDFRVDYAPIPELHVGDVIDMTLGAQEFAEFLFTAPEDGVYVLWDAIEKDYPALIYVQYPDGNMGQIYKRNEIHARAGDEFYIQIRNPYRQPSDAYTEQMNIELHLEKAVEAEDFQLYMGVEKEPADQHFTYSGGMSFMVTVQGNEPNEIVSDLEWSVSDDSVVVMENWGLPGAPVFATRNAGTATITATSASLGITRTIQVTVKDYMTLETGVTKTVELNEQWTYEMMTFVPEESGRYTFTVDSDEPVMMDVLDMMGFDHFERLSNSTGNQMVLELEGGKTYYVQVVFSDQAASPYGTVTLRAEYDPVIELHVGEHQEMMLEFGVFQEFRFVAPEDGIYVIWDDNSNGSNSAFFQVFYPDGTMDGLLRRNEIHANAGDVFTIVIANRNSQDEIMHSEIRLEKAVPANDFSIMIGMNIRDDSVIYDYPNMPINAIIWTDPINGYVDDIVWSIDNTDVIDFRDYGRPSSTGFITKSTGTATVTATSESLGISRSFTVVIKDHIVIQENVPTEIVLDSQWNKERLLFVPETSGEYIIKVDTDQYLYTGIIDMMGFDVYDVLNNQEGNTLTVNLEAGVTYYIDTLFVDPSTAPIGVFTITVAPAGQDHVPGEAVEENRVEATCTESGSYDMVVYCQICGEELSRETITTEPTGHNYDLAEVTGPGETTYRCSCGDTYVTYSAGWALFEGKWYYRYADFTLATGWLTVNNATYYMQPDGIMVTGLIEIDGSFYYFGSNGAMRTGWQSIDGKPHLFGQNGAAVVGWYNDGTYWYYLKVNGEAYIGWVKVGSHWYYMNTEGQMQTGWLTIGSNKYYLRSSGTMVTGLTNVDGKYYYFSSGGVMMTGRQTIDHVQYIFGEDGAAITGWYQTDEGWYYLKNTGAVSTGWVKGGNYWYYMNAHGIMQTGWVRVGNYWYYMNKSGVMMTGWVKSGNYWYYMSSGGVMQTGWVRVGSNWYFMNASGVMQTGWVKSGGNWYYMNASGVMLTGTHVINGKTYTFSSSGVWIP